MPEKAGIHDFSVSVTKALDPGAPKKSWMPAFAGMTCSMGGPTFFSKQNILLLRPIAAIFPFRAGAAPVVKGGGEGGGHVE